MRLRLLKIGQNKTKLYVFCTKGVRLGCSAAVTNKLVSFFCAPSALSRTSCFNSIHCPSPFAFFVARSICNDTRLLWSCKEILSGYFFSSFLYYFVIFQSLFNFIRKSGRKEILPVDNLSVSPVALFLPFVTILPPIGRKPSFVRSVFHNASFSNILLPKI